MKKLNQQGLFCSIEGTDGAGKSTQISLMYDYLTELGYPVVKFREPGGTSVGELVRGILLNEQMDPLTELLLFTASRIELIKTKIVPALEENKIVLCDRFVDSTYAYQGCGRGLKQDVLQLESLINQYVHVDHTLYLDVGVDKGNERLRQTGKAADRFESEGSTFFEDIRVGFQERLKSYPERITYINAEEDLDTVSKRVKTWIDEVLIPRYLAKSS